MLQDPGSRAPSKIRPGSWESTVWRNLMIRTGCKGGDACRAKKRLNIFSMAQQSISIVQTSFSWPSPMFSLMIRRDLRGCLSVGILPKLPGSALSATCLLGGETQVPRTAGFSRREDVSEGVNRGVNVRSGQIAISAGSKQPKASSLDSMMLSAGTGYSTNARRMPIGYGSGSTLVATGTIMLKRRLPGA